MTLPPTGKLHSEVMHALAKVMDPEIPVVSIMDMGMVHTVEVASPRVIIKVLPTFVGCPATSVIEKEIIRAVRNVPSIEDVLVEFVYDPPWTTDRITENGRTQLASYGIAPPSESRDSVSLICPYCGSEQTTFANLFGPAACRMIAYCEACKNPFEALKTIRML